MGAWAIIVGDLRGLLGSARGSSAESASKPRFFYGCVGAIYDVGARLALALPHSNHVETQPRRQEQQGRTGGSQLSPKTYIQEFSDKRILIVEDEYFLAAETRRKLEKLGAHVVGPTGRVSEALELIDADNVDAAILDIHLGDELVFPVAERLSLLDIPFVFATGYDPSIIPKTFTGFTLCEKPTELEAIARQLFGPGTDMMS